MHMPAHCICCLNPQHHSPSTVKAVFARHSQRSQALYAHACPSHPTRPLQGFRKVDPDRWEFATENFLRGRRDLLIYIQRRKPSQQGGTGGSHNATQALVPGQSAIEVRIHANVGGRQGRWPCTAAVWVCVLPAASISVSAPLPIAASLCCPPTAPLQLGNFGGMQDEIDALKRDKNVLMMELVRLRQQQQVRCPRRRQWRPASASLGSGIDIGTPAALCRTWESLQCAWLGSCPSCAPCS